MTRSLEIARRIGPDLIDLRRHLHRIPELALDLPKTQAAVLDALAGLDLEISTGAALSSVVAVLRGRGPDPADGVRKVVLLRGDMDALPVTEKVDLPYASEHDGVMHACGHDLHVAGLVGAARVLHELRDELAGDVVFMFQPGAEDFSFVAELVPSAYLNLSACASDDPKAAPDNHSTLAAFDDSVLPDAAAALAELALRRLNG